MTDAKIGVKARKNNRELRLPVVRNGRLVCGIAFTRKVERRGWVTGKKKPLKPSGVVQHTK